MSIWHYEKCGSRIGPVVVGNLTNQLDLNSPVRFFRSRIAQACPRVNLQLLRNFFRGRPADLADDVDVAFTQALDMALPDNGWQAAR